MIRHFYGRTLILLSATFFSTACHQKPQSDSSTNQSSKQALPDQKAPIEKKPDPLAKFKKAVHKVNRNSTTYETLANAGLTGIQIHNLVQTAKEHTDLAAVKSGSKFIFYWTDALETKLKYLHFPISKIKTLKAELIPEEDQWQIQLEEKAVETVTRTFQSTVDSSLWLSASNTGMTPEVIAELAETFAWQVDFSREVQKGDKWRLVVEQRLVEGEHYEWGEIKAAEYVNHGELFSAILFKDEKGFKSYYAPDGTSLKKLFLKSPVKFSRITSGFSKKRFHPILKINRPHNGIDYAARTGTPVMAVGDGKVVKKGRRGGSGNRIEIRHNSVYRTSYHHLHGFAKGLRIGSRVQQGDVIGYVGQTGLATGPHLHFVFTENGRYVDPLGLKFPSADPVPKKLMTEFKSTANDYMAMLPAWSSSPKEVISSNLDPEAKRQIEDSIQ